MMNQESFKKFFFLKSRPNDESLQHVELLISIEPYEILKFSDSCNIEISRLPLF